MSKLVDISVIKSAADPAGIDSIVISGSPEAFVTAKAPDKLKTVVDAVKRFNNFHFVSDGSWSLHDLLLSIIDLYAPAEVWLTTYSITQFPASILAGFIQDGKISKLNILMDYRAKDRYPAVEQLISNVSTLKLTPIHAKLFIIRNDKECLTLLGSANWTTNKRIEAGVVDKAPLTAQMHIDWITKKMQNADPFE